MEARDYQVEAVRGIYRSLSSRQHPVVSMPTGSGKSVVVAMVAEKLNQEFPGAAAGRIIISVPSRELAEQNERALKAFIDPGEIGVVCASLGRKEVGRRILIGTPQSLCGVVSDPDCVIVDEAHMMPLHKGSWFARLFEGFKNGRQTQRIGLSATTFRTADGAIYGPKAWFTDQPFEITVSDLVARGYLSPVRYVSPRILMTVKGVSKTAGDYNQSQLVEANLEAIPMQVKVILNQFKVRRKAMIFAVTVDHAKAYVDELDNHGESASLIVGAMSAGDRRESVKKFRSGENRIAVTVQAGLTGFDVPDIDLIASCRPTMSPIIHTQSIGRGTRPFDGKKECVVIDFAKNIPLFGPVHEPHFDKSGQPLGGVAPWRACPQCATFNHFREFNCTHCKTQLQVRKAMTSDELEFGTISFAKEMAGIAQVVAERGTRSLPVESFAVHAYRKKSDPNSVTCMISFGLGGDAVVRMWFKRMNTGWWKDHWRMLLGDMPPPYDLKSAYNRRHELVRPASIDISKEGDFWVVTNADYDDEEEGLDPLLIETSGPQHGYEVVS